RTRGVVDPVLAGAAVGGLPRRRRPAPAHGLGRARGRRRRAAGRVRALGAPRPAHPGAGRAGRRGRAARAGVDGSTVTPDAPVTRDAPVTPDAVTPDAVTLDVVICTYDNARMLDRALAALARQEAPEAARWSVLVVDNNCTDDTAAVVEAHRAAGAVPGLRRVVEPEQGLTPARLCGVRHTAGDWVAFVDDDCLLREDWVRRAAAFAAAHPACGAFGGRVVLDWEAPPPSFVRRHGYAFAEQDHGEAAREVTYLVGAGLVVRRAALEACGWTRRQYLGDRVGRRLVSGGDVEITLRIHGAGFPLWYHPDCVLRHVIPASR